MDGMKEENEEEKLDENIILELDAQKARHLVGCTTWSIITNILHGIS